MFSSDIAIDLGTANTLVYVAGKGIVVNEPSIVAVNRKTREVLGYGADAQEMLGRTPSNILAVKPLRDGVIADFELAEQMLTYFIHKANKRRKLIHPRIAIGIPSDTTEVEKRAVLDSTYRAKASEVHLVEQAMVAAIGAGLPVTEPGGNMVVDIGGGTTDIAVISLSGIVYARSIRMAGNQMDEAISEHIKRKHGLMIGERSAEKIKMEIGSAYQSGEPRSMSVKGRDMVYGLPKTVTLQDDEIREALADCVNIIVNAVRAALERTPPELSGDISERGIILTGGGSLLRSLDERLRFETGMPVLVAEEPLASVVLGTGKMLEDFKLLRKMSIN
jgi:rod shape-determining protein MreB